MDKNEVRKHLCSLYKEFLSYVVEKDPHYVDADFYFDAFMNYLNMQEDDELRKAICSNP